MPCCHVRAVVVLRDRVRNEASHRNHQLHHLFLRAELVRDRFP